jgi:hypothetical protein
MLIQAEAHNVLGISLKIRIIWLAIGYALAGVGCNIGFSFPKYFQND